MQQPRYIWIVTVKQQSTGDYLTNDKKGWIYLRAARSSWREACIHNLCNLFWWGVWEMPRFTEGVWAHEIHPVYMTMWFFSSISFQDLQQQQNFYLIRHVGFPRKNSLHMVFNLSMSWNSTIYKVPRLVIQGKGRSGQFATPVELVLAQVTHQCQQISSEQHLEQEPIK
jgi:hypothetical protein